MIYVLYIQYSAKKWVLGGGFLNRFPLILFVEGGYDLCVCVCVREGVCVCVCIYLFVYLFIFL